MTSAEFRAAMDAMSHQWMHTGSRYICDPAPTDTDDDYIVKPVSTTVVSFEAWLSANGFERTSGNGKYEGMADFEAWRCGEINVILTYGQAYYDRFCAATELARSLNLLEKEERIALFQSILYGAI